MKYSLGALKDKEDKRDYLIKDYLAKIELPAKLDYSDSMVPVRDQGGEGSCTAFAGCAVKESQEINEGYLSTRYLYERVKQPGGGAYPRDIMTVLLKTGVCPESCQPYIANSITPVCPDADELAKPNKIQGYAKLSTLDEMKQSLFQNGCFLVAVAVTQNWFNVGTDGLIFEGGDVIGYHAIAFVGYDNGLQRIKFKNSWSESWGDKGYGYLGYDHFMHILSDAWSAIDILEEQEEGNPPEPEPTPTPPEPGFMDKHWIPVLIITIIIIVATLKFISRG